MANTDDNTGLTDWDILAQLDHPAAKREPKPRAKTKATPRPPTTASKLLDPVAFNHQAELDFRDLVDRLVADGPQPVAYVIGYVAFELDISPATAKRYLIKYSTHPGSPFVVDRGLVTRRA